MIMISINRRFAAVAATLVLLCSAALGDPSANRERQIANQVARIDHLLNLTASEKSQITQIIQQQQDALARLSPDERMGMASITINQEARFTIRSVLTPGQQAVYDVSPQLAGGGAAFNRSTVLARLDRLVHLTAGQKEQAEVIFDRQLEASGAIAPGKRTPQTMSAINQEQRSEIRLILTPEQQTVYDTSPQSAGGGAMINAANQVANLDQNVSLTDAQVVQIAGIYQHQIEAVAALAPADRVPANITPLWKATRAEVRALLTPEQQAKLDANPANLIDLEERSFVIGAIKASTSLAGQLGSITQVKVESTAVTLRDDKAVSGEYHYKVVGTAASATLTVNWQTAPETGTVSILKVVNDAGAAVQL